MVAVGICLEEFPSPLLHLVLVDVVSCVCQLGIVNTLSFLGLFRLSGGRYDYRACRVEVAMLCQRRVVVMVEFDC